MAVAAIIACLSSMVTAAVSSEAASSPTRQDIRSYLAENVKEDKASVSVDRPFLASLFSAPSGDDTSLKDTGHGILVKFTVADASYLSGDETIDSLFSDPEKAGNALLTQSYGSANVYDPGDGGKYWIAFLDSTHLNLSGKVVDAEFAKFNTDGDVIDGIEYDKSKGIAYIPKSYFFDDKGRELNRSIQAQLLVSKDTSRIADAENYVTAFEESHVDGVSPVSSTVTEKQASLDVTTRVPVVAKQDAGKVSLENIKVYNGDSQNPISMSSDNAVYDQGTGELTLAMSPMAISNMRVKIVPTSDANVMPADVQYSNPDSLLAYKPGHFNNMKGKNVFAGYHASYTSDVRYKSVGWNGNFQRYIDGGLQYLYAFVGNSANDPGNNPTNNGWGSSAWLWNQIAANNDLDIWETVKNHLDKPVDTPNGMDTVTDVNFIFSLPGRIDQPRDSRNTDWTGLGDLAPDLGWLMFPAYCAHVKQTGNHLTGSDISHYGTTYLKVLYTAYDRSDPYMIIALATPQITTQSGIAVLKVNVQNKVGLGIKKVAQKDVKDKDGNIIIGDRSKYGETVIASWSDLTSSNPFKYKGIRFKLYQDVTRPNEEGRATLVSTFNAVTDDGGYAWKDDIDPGWYFIHEEVTGGVDDKGNVSPSPNNGTLTQLKFGKEINGDGQIVQQDYTYSPHVGFYGADGVWHEQWYHEGDHGWYHVYVPARADSNASAFVVEFEDPMGLGNLELQKASMNPTLTNRNDDYSVEGALYGIWSGGDAGVIWQEDPSKQLELTDVKGNPITGFKKTTAMNAQNVQLGTKTEAKMTLIRTDANGRGRMNYLYPGKYWVHEVKPSKGYQLDTTNGQRFLLQTGEKDDKGNAITKDMGAEAGFDDSGWYPITIWPQVENKFVPNDNDPSVGVWQTVQGYGQNVLNTKDGSSNPTVEEPVNMPGKLTITKVDGQNQSKRLGKATFRLDLLEDLKNPGGTLVHKAQQGIATMTTAADGTASASNLPLGSSDPTWKKWSAKYRLVETTPPDGYQPIDPIDITISGDATNKREIEYSATIKNYTKKVPHGKIAVTKTDAETGKAIGKEVGFDIYATRDIKLKDGTLLQAKGLVKNVNIRADARTGKGESGDLPLNEEGDGTWKGYYELREGKVDGYQPHDPIPVTITAPNETAHPTQSVSVENHQDHSPSKGTITIDKRDSVSGAKLANAVFSIYADEDIALPDGTRKYTKGQLVQSGLKTDENGSAKSQELWLRSPSNDWKSWSGRFKVTETTYPADHAPMTKETIVTVTGSSSTAAVFNKTQRIDNKPVGRAKIRIIKTDSVHGNPIEGAVFKVVATKDIKDANGKTLMPQGDVPGMTNLTTGKDGSVISGELPIDANDMKGYYKVVEVNIPKPFHVKDGKKEWPVTIDAKGGDAATVLEAVVNVTNVPTFGYIKVKKTDAVDGRGIKDVHFQIQASRDFTTWDGYSYKKGDPIMQDGKPMHEIFTDENGEGQSGQLPLEKGTGEGPYQLVETYCPPQYQLTPGPIDAHIAYNGGTAEAVYTPVIEVKDDRTPGKGKIRVTKTDSDGKTPVEGAIYRITSVEDVKAQNGSFVYHAGDEIATIKTNAQGIAETGEIPLGVNNSVKAVIKEISPAPEGYLLDENEHELTISQTFDKITEVALASVNLTDTPNGFELMKTLQDPHDPDGKETPLRGAKFWLWRKSDELPLSPAKGKDAYALRIGGLEKQPDMDRSVVLSPVTEAARVSLKDGETDGADGEDAKKAKSLALRDERGNTYAVPRGETISVPAGRYSVTMQQDGEDAPMTGPMTVSMDAGEAYSYEAAVSDDGKASAKPSDEPGSGDIALKADKENNAYMTDSLMPGTTYEVKVDGRSVGRVTTSDDGGQTHYARYDEKNKVVAYVDQPMLLTSDNLRITTTGRDNEDVPTETNGQGTLRISYIPQGEYGFGEMMPPTNGDGSNKRMPLVATTVVRISVGADGKVNGKSIETAAIEDKQSQVEISKNEVTGGPEIPGSHLEIRDTDDKVVEEWTSTDTSHVVVGLAPEKYYLVERMTPNNYDQATRVEFWVNSDGKTQKVEMHDQPIHINAQIDKRQEIADPVAADTEANGDDKNKADVTQSDEGKYEYSLDYRNDSSTWVDEFTVYDPLDGVSPGLTRLEGITTGQGYEDYDGKLNVWFQTNKTPADYSDDAGKANATKEDGHPNAWLENPNDDIKGRDPDGDGRILSYTGWRLWKKDVSAVAATQLKVSNLGLSDGEYVTGVRLEYGRVEKGFTTRPDGWDRSDLKDAHDDMKPVEQFHDGTFGTDGISALNAKASLVEAIVGSAVSSETGDADGGSAAGSAAVLESEKAKLDEALGAGNVETVKAAMGAYAAAAKQAMTEALGKDTGDGKVIRTIADAIETSLGKASDALPEDARKEIADAIAKAKGAVSNGDGQAIATATKGLADAFGKVVDSLAATDGGEQGQDGDAVHYAATIMDMRLTDAYVPGVDLDNSAYVDAYRNGGGEGLEGHDQDKVTQTPKAADLASDSLAQTGDPVLGAIASACGFATAASLVAFITRKGCLK